MIQMDIIKNHRPHPKIVFQLHIQQRIFSIIQIQQPQLLKHQSKNSSRSRASPFAYFRFKSPLIQNLLNKARSSRSTDNLIQTSMTASQIIAEPETDEGTMPVTIHISSSSSSDDDNDDDDDQQDSGINNTTNGHSDSP